MICIRDVFPSDLINFGTDGWSATLNTGETVSDGLGMFVALIK
jgi:hypothetical protein